MVENYRSGLIWNKFMEIAPVKNWVKACLSTEVRQPRPRQKQFDNNMEICYLISIESYPQL